MDQPISPVAIAVRTVIESCGLNAEEALRTLEGQLTTAQWFDDAFHVFPVPHHLSAAKPKPWRTHGIAFANCDDAIVIACKESATQDGVQITIVSKHLLQGAPQRPPVRRRPSLQREVVDLTNN
ncbi:hypothetical protein KBC55_00225 [Patescibacteria group bacterium]|nr:hypothetical protein [Patescibacteria group bacterium]